MGECVDGRNGIATPVPTAIPLLISASIDMSENVLTSVSVVFARYQHSVLPDQLRRLRLNLRALLPEALLHYRRDQDSI